LARTIRSRAAGQLSLMIILPNEGEDLYQLQKQITYDDYSLVAKGLTLQRLRIFLPVLEVNSFYTLKDTFQTAMPSLFQRGANLTGMIRKLVWVDQVYHAVKFSIEPENELPFKRFIDLQREAQLSKILFINRPFIFFVKDNATNAILFLGHVYKPI
jgi:serpin B